MSETSPPTGTPAGVLLPCGSHCVQVDAPCPSREHLEHRCVYLHRVGPMSGRRQPVVLNRLHVPGGGGRFQVTPCPPPCLPLPSAAAAPPPILPPPRGAAPPPSVPCTDGQVDGMCESLPQMLQAAARLPWNTVLYMSWASLKSARPPVVAKACAARCRYIVSYRAAPSGRDTLKSV